MVQHGIRIAEVAVRFRLGPPGSRNFIALRARQCPALMKFSLPGAPGISAVVARMVRVHEAASSNLASPTEGPPEL